MPWKGVYALKGCLCPERVLICEKCGLSLFNSNALTYNPDCLLSLILQLGYTDSYDEKRRKSSIKNNEIYAEITGMSRYSAHPAFSLNSRKILCRIIRDYDELDAILNRCNKKYDLNLNPAWVKAVLMYHRSVNKNGDALMGWMGGKRTEQHICNTYERNIMVNLYGQARLCFSPVFPAYNLSKPGNLKYFWKNSEFIRERMKNCNAYCGISHSVRRENATLKPLG